MKPEANQTYIFKKPPKPHRQGHFLRHPQPSELVLQIMRCYTCSGSNKHHPSDAGLAEVQKGNPGDRHTGHNQGPQGAEGKGHCPRGLSRRLPRRTDQTTYSTIKGDSRFSAQRTLALALEHSKCLLPVFSLHLPRSFSTCYDGRTGLRALLLRTGHAKCHSRT